MSQAQITWTLYLIYADGKKSLVDIMDWAPNYNGTAKQQWRYFYGVIRATMRRDGAKYLDGARFELKVTGR